MSKDNTQAVLQQVWLTALREGKVVLTFAAKSDLVRTRFMLYNAAKTIRTKGMGGGDQAIELLEAVDNCMISVTDERTLTIQHKAMAPLIQNLAAQLGMTLEQAVAETPEAKAAEESLQKLQGMLSQPEPLPERKNPFYKRED